MDNTTGAIVPHNFLELVDLLQHEPRVFPMMYWDERFNVLRLYTKDCSYYSDFVDTRLSILRENETNEIIGVEFWMEHPPIVRL